MLIIFVTTLHFIIYKVLTQYSSNPQHAAPFIISKTPTIPSSPLSTLPSDPHPSPSNNSNIQRITPQTIRRRRLKLKNPLLLKTQHRIPIRIRRHAINRRALHRRPRSPIYYLHSLTLPFLNHHLLRRHLQKPLQIKRIIRPQHLIPSLNLILTPPYRCELVINQQAPELGSGFGIGSDGGDEEIVEFGVEGAVEGEMEELGGGGEGIGGGVAGGGVDAVVGAVAEVGAAGGGGDVARAGEDGAFVDGGGGAFDAEVYEGVSVGGGG